MTTSLAASRPSSLPARLLLRWTGKKVLSAEADMFIGGMGIFPSNPGPLLFAFPPSSSHPGLDLHGNPQAWEIVLVGA